MSTKFAQVDVYLGSLGFIRPGRESAMMRSSKRLVRAVRGGYKALEFRGALRNTTGVFMAAVSGKQKWGSCLFFGIFCEKQHKIKIESI